ncbi:MAG: adenylate/guanylate cyclase domain-containing protein [Bdellovibrionota bacterium]
MSQSSASEKRVVALLQVHYPRELSEGQAELPSTDSTSLITEVYQLYAGTTLRVGRAKTNDIIVSDRDVSRFHATFSASENGVVLSDLSSTNGTFVNGRRISTPVDILSADSVTLGNARIDVQLHYTDDMSQADGTRTALSELQTVEVTVLLVDIVGYTRHSQELPADAVAKMLRSWFELVGPIIVDHGGEIDKYIGDCVMALWRGSAATVTKKATSAVEAAIDIIRKTKELGLSENWPYSASHPWFCRAALNSGTALFGAVGAGDRRNYTVLGDAINVAFRIESLAGKLKTDVILSQNTAVHVKDSFPLRPLGSFDLEGRTGETELFAIDDPAASKPA